MPIIIGSYDFKDFEDFEDIIFFFATKNELDLLNKTFEVKECVVVQYAFTWK